MYARWRVCYHYILCQNVSRSCFQSICRIIVLWTRRNYDQKWCPNSEMYSISTSHSHQTSQQRNSNNYNISIIINSFPILSFLSFFPSLFPSIHPSIHPTQKEEKKNPEYWKINQPTNQTNILMPSHCIASHPSLILHDQKGREQEERRRKKVNFSLPFPAIKLLHQAVERKSEAGPKSEFHLVHGHWPPFIIRKAK